jgi:hypothetical protein
MCWAHTIFWFNGSLQNTPQEAINACCQRGGTQCKRVSWFRSACGALAIAQDNNGYGAGWGAATVDAWKMAQDECEKFNQKCHIRDPRCANVL